MFGIGLPEFILILALALIVVGPDKLPDLARSVAKGILDLKKTANTLKESLTEEGNPLEDIKPELQKAAKALTDDVLGDSSDDWSSKNRDKIYDLRSTGEKESSEIIDIEVEKDADSVSIMEEAVREEPAKEVDNSKTNEILAKKESTEQQS
ncbi:Sec-independent protein secretion pathway component [Desulfocapsa sulfexigens DSM 10523]|uniref:Sec-independent protein secretion pathway component n=1 Tax=Desulfocapsa sulfexigens (strain DSM 10523 / SB164P1) TaxID=1167006 RepID=M1PB23_DESSD|nr:twin-arginine translocase TatA/TatE family subunit [Desulfocapsa sulfexigens]AGF78847.1 Sec-independent protein secretion pathway component [Desulfocapsa sulfexigens DSM 10523]